jgi:hypothetical protein
MTYAAPYGARRNGRTTWIRLKILAAVAQGGHAHYLARDGEWCVTAQQAGVLWERLPARNPHRKEST